MCEEPTTVHADLGLCIADRPPHWVSLGTGGAAVDPYFHLGNSVLAAERRESAAIAGIPTPSDKFVVRNVFEKLLQRAATSLFWVLELATEFGWSATDEDHFVFRRRQTPFGTTGWHVIAGQVGGLMAGFAAHGSDAVAVFAAFYVLQV
jgi:hypothetical protein